MTGHQGSFLVWHHGSCFVWDFCHCVAGQVRSCLCKSMPSCLTVPSSDTGTARLGTSSGNFLSLSLDFLLSPHFPSFPFCELGLKDNTNGNKRGSTQRKGFNSWAVEFIAPLSSVLYLFSSAYPSSTPKTSLQASREAMSASALASQSSMTPNP